MTNANGIASRAFPVSSFAPARVQFRGEGQVLFFSLTSHSNTRQYCVRGAQPASEAECNLREYLKNVLLLRQTTNRLCVRAGIHGKAIPAAVLSNAPRLKIPYPA